MRVIDWPEVGSVWETEALPREPWIVASHFQDCWRDGDGRLWRYSTASLREMGWRRIGRICRSADDLKPGMRVRIHYAAEWGVRAGVLGEMTGPTQFMALLSDDRSPQISDLGHVIGISGKPVADNLFREGRVTILEPATTMRVTEVDREAKRVVYETWHTDDRVARFNALSRDPDFWSQHLDGYRYTRAMSVAGSMTWQGSSDGETWVNLGDPWGLGEATEPSANVKKAIWPCCDIPVYAYERERWEAGDRVCEMCIANKLTACPRCSESPCALSCSSGNGYARLQAEKRAAEEVLARREQIARSHATDDRITRAATDAHDKYDENNRPRVWPNLDAAREERALAREASAAAVRPFMAVIR